MHLHKNAFIVAGKLSPRVSIFCNKLFNSSMMSSCTKVGVVLVLAAQVATLVLAGSYALQPTPRLVKRSQVASLETVLQATPCQNAGYGNGCCNIGATTCYVSPANCYCDLSCHLYGDCCRDIQQIGCYPPSQDTCEDIPAPANGRIDFNPHTNPKRPGTIAHHSCNMNFALVGSLVRVCQQNLQWSGSPATCRRVCSVLNPPANGSIRYIIDSTSLRKPERTVAIYSCNKGYVLFNGNERRVCQNNQMWSGHKPRCQANTCSTSFGGGCCTTSNCFVPYTGDPLGPSCSCALSCLSDGNCCPDIGCVRPVASTCSEAGLDPGCCSLQQDLRGCHVSGNGGCHCDENCHSWNDCCSDVSNSTTCSITVSRQGVMRQSVRTRPLSRARLASRYRAGQAAGMGDQSARELASELRSMSQVRVNPKQDDKTHWEKIVEELKEINKKNHY